MYKGKKISVAMATYNGEKYIAEQLESILSQTVLPDEIVISDDGSSDNTLEIVRIFESSLLKHGVKLVIFQNDTTLGFARNFEKTILHAEGDFIFLCDQDDVWEQTKIEEIIDVFRQFPDVELVMHEADQIDSAGNFLAGERFFEGLSFAEIAENTALIEEDASLAAAVSGPIAAGMVMCVSRDFARRVLPFRGGCSLCMIIGCSFALSAIDVRSYIDATLLIIAFMETTLRAVVSITDQFCSE